jgi:myo-inositol-1(or 4)-monophosphatase
MGLNYNTFLDFAKDIAIKAGKIQLNSFRKPHTIKYKGPVDIVTEVDIQCQKMAIEKISQVFPDHSILAEEEGLNIRDEKSEARWIIDPLDGTTNYAHGIPLFCFSIALEIDSDIVIGCAYNPVMNELFYASNGNGSFLNGKKINVSKTDVFERSLISTGFPYDKKENPDNNFDHFKDISINVRGIRRLGSAVLDLCYCACGFLDGYWELNLRPWDMASGYLMVKEANGKVTDFCGKAFNLYDGKILASNGLIHEHISQILCK